MGRREIKYAGKSKRSDYKNRMAVSEILPEETMEFLRGDAEDYGKVKRAAFDRFPEIRSPEKLAAVFNIIL